MKDRFSKLSLFSNALLAAGLVWMYVEHRADQAETEAVLSQCMRADEHYIRLLAESLEVLDPVKSEEAETYRGKIGPLVAAGFENMELRKRVGFPR